MSLHYAWEKTFLAVLTLAEGTDRIQRRLEYAGEILCVLEPHDVPIAIQDRIIYLRRH